MKTQPNQVLRVVLAIALLAATFPEPAWAARGGFGRAGGGGFGGGREFGGGGGMGRSETMHTPTFSTPRTSGNFERSNIGQGTRPSSGERPASDNRGTFENRGGDNNWNHNNNNNNNNWNHNNNNNNNNWNHNNNWNNNNNWNHNNNWNNNNNWGHNNWNNQYWNRPNWYHGGWHNNWDHPWYNQPAAWWTAGVLTGAAVTAAITPWSWGYWPYYNPYYVAPVVVGTTTIDYSQPIVLAAPPAANAAVQPAPANQPSPADQAMELLDAARASFAQGDYQAALAQVEQAIALQPNDTVSHEFRGLVLFAMGKYKESAAAIYAVLSVGPGWDWTTLSSFYPDTAVYTAQLRALEQYHKQNPQAAEADFLLGYQYLTCGYTDAAAARFKAVVRLNPQDRLSAQLLASLASPDTGGQPPPSEPAAAPVPVEAARLVGSWTANRPEGSPIHLALAQDGQYTWKFVQNEKPQNFSGAYSVADNLLILKQGTNPVMVGQVTPLASGGFNFKLTGGSPSDPGLTFNR